MKRFWRPVYAVINLKNCTVRIQDGGTINDDLTVDGVHTVGSTTIELSNVTTTMIDEGDMISFAGHPEYHYYVKDVSPTADNVVITPGLQNALESGEGVAVYHAPSSIDIKIGEGDLTYSEKRPREYTKDRGRLDTVRDADEEPMDVSFQFTWEWLTSESGASVPTIEEALKQRGPAASWNTSSEDSCEPFCVDIVIFNEPGGNNPNCGTSNELTILPEFRYETLEHSIKNGNVSCTGRCNCVEALVARDVTYS